MNYTHFEDDKWNEFLWQIETILLFFLYSQCVLRDRAHWNENIQKKKTQAKEAYELKRYEIPKEYGEQSKIRINENNEKKG